MKILLFVPSLLLVATSLLKAEVTALVADNPCTVGWTGVQSSFLCSASQWSEYFRDSKHVALVAPAGVVGLIGLLTFFAIIFAFVFRYCCQCCGSSRLRPGHGCCGGSDLDELSDEAKLRMYSHSEVWWTKTLTLFVCLVAVCGCALAVQGAVQSSDIADIIKDGSPKFTGWVDGKLDDVTAQINTTNPSFQSAVDKMSQIRTDMNNFARDTGDRTGDMDTVKKALLGLAGPSALVVIAAAGAVICALCSVRTCLPFTLLVVTMLAALVTGTLGLGTGLVGVADDVWCEEVDAFNSNESGLFKWYIVPNLCERKIDFPALKKNIEDDISDLVAGACEKLAGMCDASPVYIAANPSKLYVCSPAPANCSTTDDLLNAMKNLTVKTGVPQETNCGGSCNVEQCAANCTNSDLRSKSDDVFSSARQANKAHFAVTTILYPLLSCDVVTRKLLEYFDLCGNVKKGLVNVFAGSAISVAACVFVAILLFLGQKRFIKSDILDREGQMLVDSARRGGKTVGGDTHHEHFEKYGVYGNEEGIRF